MWTRVWSHAARMASERLSAGGRVLVVGPRSRRLAVALRERSLDAAVAEASSTDSVIFSSAVAEKADRDMLVLVFILSRKSDRERRAVLEAARAKAPLLLLVDWQRPERNLEMPADLARRSVLRVTSPAATRRSLDAYDAAGGLEGVLYALRGRGRVETRASRLGGCVGLALVAWN